MHSDVCFRKGDDNSLAEEYIEALDTGMIISNYERIASPIQFTTDDILAVHFANAGAQGEAGAVNMLYTSQSDIINVRGNYKHGRLDIDDVFRVLPMLKCLDSRNNNPPYPLEGTLDIPDGWKYIYMGAGNHLYVREKLDEEAAVFLDKVINQIGGSMAFNALAWFCGQRCYL